MLWHAFRSWPNWQGDHFVGDRARVLVCSERFIDAGGPEYCVLLPCTLPILDFILSTLTQREEEHLEEETSLFRGTWKNEDGEGRAMITPALREALTKQGKDPYGGDCWDQER
jgi:hypothetical protein